LLGFIETTRFAALNVMLFGSMMVPPLAAQTVKPATKATAPPSKPIQVFQPTAEGVAFLRTVSAPYDLDGKFVDPDSDRSVAEAALASRDPGLAELALAINQMRECHELHQRLVKEVKSSSDQAVIGLTVDLLMRLAQAVKERADGPPPEIIGDAFTRQSEVLPAWKQELTAQFTGRSLANVAGERLRAYADGHKADATTSPATAKLACEFVESGPHRSFIRITNRSKSSIPGCLLLVHTVPDPVRAGAVRAIEDFGFLPVLFGAPIGSVTDRKQINDLYIRCVSIDRTIAVFVPEFPAGGIVEMIPCDSPGTLAIAQSCEISFWPVGFASGTRKVSGLAVVQSKPR